MPRLVAESFQVDIAPGCPSCESAQSLIALDPLAVRASLLATLSRRPPATLLATVDWLLSVSPHGNHGKAGAWLLIATQCQIIDLVR